MNENAHRKELDGLRAIAVLAVIITHAGTPGLQGGFIGVDVFFVLSGYFITGILARQISAGRFSFFDFYDRRVRRILPALNVMLLLFIPIAYLTMLPGNLENFGQSLIATNFFSNNVLLYLTVGYFDLSAEFKPLLHTWSLGVEEQYYFAAPLILWISFRKFGEKGFVGAMAIITIVSFLLSIGYSTIDQDANFYLVPTRAWELGAGALIALWLPNSRSLASRPVREIITGVGLAAIILSCWLLDSTSKTPGFYAIPAVA